MILTFSYKKQTPPKTQNASSIEQNKQTSSVPIATPKAVEDRFSLQANTSPLQVAVYQSATALLNQGYFQGVSLVVSHGDKSYQAVAGTTGVNTKTPITKETAFGIGSVTKTFTAVAILKLVEAGKIKLGAPITDYLPATTVENLPTASQITVRDLLHQTSGLPDYIGDTDFALNELFFKAPNSPKATTSQLLSYVKEEKPKAPHQAWEYCNTNYLLLGDMLEAVTKQPLETVYRNLIFNPLKLNNTFAHPETVSAKQSIATGGWEDGYDPLVQNAGGAGCLYSTANDLQTFFRALFKEKTVLNPKSLTEMMAISPNDGSNGYGLGIVNLGTEQNPILAHNGQSFNYGSLCIYNPETDVLITGIASNKLTKSKIANAAFHPTSESTGMPGNIPLFEQALEKTPLYPALTDLLHTESNPPTR
jgi:D-alanyl-D-alanine carboxypeptidase